LIANDTGGAKATPAQEKALRNLRADNPGGKDRAQALIKVAPLYVHGPHYLAVITAALKCVIDLAHRRHQFLHTMWGVSGEWIGISRGSRDVQTRAQVIVKHEEWITLNATVELIEEAADSIAAAGLGVNNAFRFITSYENVPRHIRPTPNRAPRGTTKTAKSG